MASTKQLSLAALMAVAAATPAVATAQAADAPTGNQAIRKGARDFVRLSGPAGATASKLKLSCRRIPQVNDKGRCTGTFDVVENGRRATYRLTRKASVLRLSPSAITYRLAAQTDAPLPGMPRRTDLAGFLQ